MKTKNMVKKKKKEIWYRIICSIRVSLSLMPFRIFYCFFSSGTIKNFNGQMRQLYVYVTNKHTFGNYCLNTLSDTKFKIYFFIIVSRKYCFYLIATGETGQHHQRQTRILLPTNPFLE